MRRRSLTLGVVTFALSAAVMPGLAVPSAGATVQLASTSASVSPARVPPTLQPPIVRGVAWKAAGRVARRQHSVYVAQIGGGRVGLMWMNPQLLSFRFIPGWEVPEHSPIRGIDQRPSTWVPRLAAAFNGGFRLRDDVGGYFYAGSLVKSLTRGLATFAVTKSGRLVVGVWGRDIRSTNGLVAVRQNLAPLVLNGKAQASLGDSAYAWGAADGGASVANRSALGMRADGSLVFAYGYEVPAATMARALVAIGVRTAIMLDMNKSWPMGFAYSPPRPGRAPEGHPIQSGIYRDASSYYEQFRKDFVVALVP